MSITVFLSNSIMYAAYGTRGGGIDSVKNVVTRQMTEPCLINGMITNEEVLSSELKSFFEENKFPVKDVRLVVNGGAFSVRKVQVPDTSKKKVLELIDKEFDTRGDEENVVYDYLILPFRQSKKLMDVVAVRAGDEQLEKWIGVFKGIGVELTSITASNLPVYKYLKGISELDKGAYIIIGVDDNGLNIILWVDGHQEQSSARRFFSDRGTPEFGSDAARLVNEMQQFYRTLKREDTIVGIRTYGFDSNDEKALKGGLDNASIKLDVVSISGEFAYAMPAVGDFIKWKKDVNLIAGRKKKKKNNSNNKKLPVKYILPPAIAAGIGVIAVGALFAVSFSKSKEIKSLKEYCESPQVLKEAEESDILNTKVGRMQRLCDELEYVDGAIASFPAINSDIILDVVKIADSKVFPGVSSYQANAGVLSITAYVKDVNDCNRYVDTLRSTGLFYDVAYTGYQYDEGTGYYEILVQGILKEKAGKKEE